MINKVKNKLKKIFGSKIASSNQVLGTFIKSDNVELDNVSIKMGTKAKLTLLNGVKIKNYNIVIEEGEMIVGENSILQQGNNSLIPSIYINKGVLNIGNNNNIKADFCIKFGGKCTIGEYNCLNELTEVRCDEKIDIGSFNLISYECMIYDTNTHCMYLPEKRRELTIKDFPNIGIEYEKPMTKPISIGNDCWVGKRSVILKGCQIGDEAVLSACSVVTKNVPKKHLAYGNPSQFKPILKS
jgi:acetyltransferase-like isoleucine patch superfamily enzyme